MFSTRDEGVHFVFSLDHVSAGVTVFWLLLHGAWVRGFSTKLQGHIIGTSFRYDLGDNCIQIWHLGR